MNIKSLTYDTISKIFEKFSLNDNLFNDGDIDKFVVFMSSNEKPYEIVDKNMHWLLIMILKEGSFIGNLPRINLIKVISLAIFNKAKILHLETVLLMLKPSLVELQEICRQSGASESEVILPIACNFEFKFISHDIYDYIIQNKQIGKFLFLSGSNMEHIIDRHPDYLDEVLEEKANSTSWPWGEFISVMTMTEIAKSRTDTSLFKKTIKGLKQASEDSEIFTSLITHSTAFGLYAPYLKPCFTSGRLFSIKNSDMNHCLSTKSWMNYIHLFSEDELLQGLKAALIIPETRFENFKTFISWERPRLDESSGFTELMREWLNHRNQSLVKIATEYAERHPNWHQAILLEQLDSKKADERSKAVSILAKNLTPAIRARFESLLPKEKSDEVRLELYKALDPLWLSEGRNFSRVDMAERLSQVSKRLAKPVAPWLDEAALPPLPLKDGSAMSVEEVRHLCSSLALMPELDIHPEARPWFDLMSEDRKASGPFALALLKAYLSSKVEPKFRFALGLAGRLGDESILPILNSQVDAWAKGSRGKMAEYAAAAIALQGSEMALMITDDIAQRYRSKNANIGSAAREAMQEVATARGLSIDQLGDAIIPWLGFVPGQPRLIPSPKGDIEVRIGSDGKLAYLIDGKLKSTAPAGISAETKTELKTLATQLRAVLKAQKARHNRMLVQERRWPLADWQKLYLSHPALRPFLVHQIWGLWNEENQLVASFRQEEVGSFVCADESAFALPASGSVGLIHPLHLDGDAHHEWKQHLAAAGIKPLVPQLERPLRLVSESEKGMTEGDWVRGVKLGGMTFKGRADRLGWIRGSVVDAGGIESYRKPFPEAGVEALLTDLDGMYIGIDPESQISLGGVCFIKLGSVQFGSYTYDTPGKGDSRLIPFGQVPPIVFSEAVSDALLIAGKTVEEEEED